MTQCVKNITNSKIIYSIENIFAISSGTENELLETPVIEVPNRSINSDDVLDIRKEAKKIGFTQIKSLGKKKFSKIAVPKITSD